MDQSPSRKSSDATPPPALTDEKLSSIVARIKGLWSDSNAKRYQAAEELMKLQAVWPAKYEESTGKSWGDWVNDTFGRGTARKIQNIANALKRQERLYNGKDARRYLTPETLVFIGNEEIVDDSKYKGVVSTLLTMPVPKDHAEAVRRVNKYLGRKPTHKPMGTQERAVWAHYVSVLWEEIDRKGGKRPKVPAELVEWF